MKKYLLFLLLLSACAASKNSTRPRLPEWMKGRFMDDYGIKYSVSDSMFYMESSAKYHILQWNEKAQYLLTRNDESNPTEKGLYTRIDYMQLQGMEPYAWGFCLTVYNAKDREAALKAPQANRDIPKKGCNGFPFSRMKRVNE